MSVLDKEVDFFSQDPTENSLLMAKKLEAFKEVNPDTSYTPIDFENDEKPWHLDQVIPEIHSSEFDVSTLRSAIASHGSLIVRDFLDIDICQRYCGIIDGMLDSPEKSSSIDMKNGALHLKNVAPNLDGFFSKKDLQGARYYHHVSGSKMVMESSTVAFELLSHYKNLGLKKILGEYLGDDPCLSVQKWVLRRSLLPINPNGWHQDGAFMGGGINSLNMWLPLTECGGDTGAPGLDIVPYRFKHIVPTGTKGAAFDWSVSLEVDELNMSKHEPISPEFKAGDAVFFDHFSLHRTQYKESSFQNKRYAIETWFFSSSNFAKNQVPVAW